MKTPDKQTYGILALGVRENSGEWVRIGEDIFIKLDGRPGRFQLHIKAPKKLKIQRLGKLIED